MNKAVKGSLIAAFVLIGIGLLLFTVSMTINHWDFSKINTAEYQTDTYEISDDFMNISVDADTLDVVFSSSGDNVCTVEFYDTERAVHTACVEKDTLIIRQTVNSGWLDSIGITIQSPRVTIRLPKNSYTSLELFGITGTVEIPDGFRFDDLSIAVSTGDIIDLASVSGKADISTSTGTIRVDHQSIGSLHLSTTTGDVSIDSVVCKGTIEIGVRTGDVILENTSCDALRSDGTTGDVTLKNVTAAQTIEIERSTGDIEITDSDAESLTVKTTTGDVSGKLLSEKIFSTDTSSGTVSVPHSLAGGTCRITTTTGDIRFS